MTAERATRSSVKVAAFAAVILLAAAAPADAEPPLGARLGGDTSRPDASAAAFTLPAANLTDDQHRQFSFGNRIFNTNWAIAPASVAKFDGLGPVFNRVSCSGCHLRDGRGRPPENSGDEMLSMLVRLSIPGRDPHGGTRPHPNYGDQLNDRAIPGVPPEGRAVIDYTEKPGKYADGEAYSLRAPRVTFHDLAFGPLGRDIMVSPRVAPAMIGLGLLEAVPAETILALAAAQAEDRQGIAGRPNQVWDQPTRSMQLGRFGWKANVASIKHQAASAAQGDIGLTSSVFLEENCMPAQKKCRAAPNGGRPEIEDEFLDRLVLYSRTLAVPERRDVAAPAVRHGETLFAEAGCNACHVVTLKTGAHEVDAVANQTIHPFTDLLLHDMGPDLADNRPDFEAGGRQWRTAPLWGIGLVETVNKHSLFLHDGRARGFAEAILWHGGEAEPARERFRKMAAEDRAALLAFLGSL